MSLTRMPSKARRTLGTVTTFAVVTALGLVACVPSLVEKEASASASSSSATASSGVGGSGGTEASAGSGGAGAGNTSTGSGPSCEGSHVVCGMACVDTMSDSNHCGKCDAPCGTGKTCEGGACKGPCNSLAFSGGIVAVEFKDFPDVVTKLGTFTVEAWVAWAGDAGPSNGNYQGILSQPNEAGTASRLFAGVVAKSNGSVCETTPGMLRLQTNGNPYCASSTGKVEANGSNWHHVAYVHEAGTMTFFIDGTPSGSKSIQFVDKAQPLLLLGSEFNGKLAAVRISKTARYKAAFSPSKLEADADTYEFFPLSEGKGPTTKASLSNLVGTLNGATWVNECPPGG